MKKRRSMLFALGIVLTLSVAVPTIAAENVTGTTVTQDSAENAKEQEAPKENNTDAVQVPQIQDEEKSVDAAGAEKEVAPTWEKHKTDGGEVWRLKLGESTDPDNDGYARDTVYTNNGNTYYINKDGIKMERCRPDTSKWMIQQQIRQLINSNRDCTIFQKKETILPQILLEVC